MVNQSSPKTLLPQMDGRALDFIKIAAAIFMVIDHINLIWLDGAVQGMFMMGRATYPLFCYALAVAFLKAGPEKASGYALRKYMPRLLLLAVLTEPISLLTRDTGLLNVIFTLALAAGITGLSFRLKDWQMIALTALAVFLMGDVAAQLGEIRPFAAFGFERIPVLPEFGFAGMLLPAALLMYMRGRKTGLYCSLALIAVMNLAGYTEAINSFSAPIAVYIMLIWFSSTVLPWWVVHWSQRLPNEGRYLHKYALHIFYPGHLLIIWGLLKIGDTIQAM